MGPLVTALLDLLHELPALPRPVLVGGGLGLYLRQRHLEERPGIRTLIEGELWPPARATEDIDLFLPTEVIIDAEHMQSIRTALDRLGYEPDVRYLQFVKQTPTGPVKIDLLTCDVPPEHRGDVKLSLPRVRPLGGVGLHAYLTREALALGLSPFVIILTGARSDGRLAEVPLCIPNPFTYLLMKLHAFHDRVEDESKDLASHHALDIYRIVAMLTREEHELVRSLRAEHADDEPVLKAVQVVRESFGDPDGRGFLRLQAGALKSGIRIANHQREELGNVLAELFPDRAVHAEG